MISRDQAKVRAEKYLQDRSMLGAFSIRHVYSVEEIQFRLPLVYGCPEESLENCWIVYLERLLDKIQLRSSMIILISKETGSTVYFGSAKDEG